jgi:hypothetical protein
MTTKVFLDNLKLGRQGAYLLSDLLKTRQIHVLSTIVNRSNILQVWYLDPRLKEKMTFFSTFLSVTRPEVGDLPLNSDPRLRLYTCDHQFPQTA